MQLLQGLLQLGPVRAIRARLLRRSRGRKGNTWQDRIELDFMLVTPT